MTLEQINIAIARHQGAKCLSDECENCLGCGECGGAYDAHDCPDCDGTGKTGFYYAGRNYTGDLNAIHETEKTLSDDERWHQIKILTDWKPSPSGFPLIGRSDAAVLLDATAEQRAKAFLRAVGKWEETV